MTPNTQTKPDFKEMVASVEEAASKTEEAAAKFTLPISNEDKTTILLNVEGAIKDLAAALAKKNEIKGADIDPSAYEHLPNSLTGVIVHYFVKGLKDELDIAFEEAPTALKMRSSNPMDKKVAGKKLDYTYKDSNRIGDHIWWVSDVRKFENHYPEWSYRYSLDDIITQIHEEFTTRLQLE